MLEISKFWQLWFYINRPSISKIGFEIRKRMLSKKIQIGFALIVNDYLGFFRDSNSQLFGDYLVIFPIF